MGIIEILIYIILFFLIINILVILYRIIRQNFEKEEINFYKNQFIINNKKLYDLKSKNFSLSLNKLGVAMDSSFSYYALVKIDIIVYEDGQKNRIKNLKNAINILKRLKEYNIEYYHKLISNYFSENNILRQVLEREIENAKKH